MERIYYTLLKKYGYQNWWPIYDGKEPFIEISVGAILTQNTSWKNVEKAILNLKRENLLTKNSLKNVDEKTLQELIKPAGFYKRKSKTIKSFIEKIDGRKDIDRDFLLSIKGIGRETADTILLYGLNKPFFVVDAYTRRIFSRLGLIDSSLKYDEIQNIFQEKLSKDTKVYKEFHALIVEHGKRHCRKTPSCSDCVLSEICYFHRKNSS